MKRMQATDAEKLLSQREKVAKCNLRVTLKYMKDVSFSWNEMLFAMQKTDFMFRAFLRAKNTNAVRAKNTNAVFSATKPNEENARPRMLKSFFLSERKVLNSILRLKLKYMKDVSFSWNEMLFAMQKTDFHVLELFAEQVMLELQCTESLV